MSAITLEKMTRGPWTVLGAVILLLTAGCMVLPIDPNAPVPTYGGTVDPASPAGAIKNDPQILNALIDVLEKVDRIRPDIKDCDSDTPPLFCEMLKVGSPIGFLLRDRYLNPGVTIAEALARDPEPLLRERLIEMARWSRQAEVRTTALIGLATFHNPKDYEVFHEAVAHIKAAIRFGTMEALMVWAREGPEKEALRKKAVPLLTVAWQKDNEPILQVYAAQALVQLEDPSGIDKLRGFLNHETWLVRAFAVRYLGTFGDERDYDVFVSQLDVEKNEFLLAEYAISALKLFPKKEAAMP